MPADSTDPALETVLLPFTSGRLAWPAAGALFLRARAGRTLLERTWPGLLCEQSFKPDADVLERAGLALTEQATGKFPLVLILPPRQRHEARALMARAIELLAPGGIVIAAASNNEGARSAESDLAEVAGPLDTLTKNKCRVFWSRPLNGPADPELAIRWRALDEVRPIADGRYVSRPGVFAWDRVDPASQLLVDHLPATLSGTAADLGAGFGTLSLELLERCPRIRSVDLFEAEARALDLARMNLEKQPRASYHWHDVTTGLPRHYDVIVTNPPFHTQSRTDRPDIGRRFIAVAGAHLNPGGSLWLVANRHLAYEAVLKESFAQVNMVAERDGFKIIAAVKR